VLDSSLLVTMFSFDMFKHVPGVPCFITTVSMGAPKWSKSTQKRPQNNNNNNQCENLSCHVYLLDESMRDEFCLVYIIFLRMFCEQMHSLNRTRFSIVNRSVITRHLWSNFPKVYPACSPVEQCIEAYMTSDRIRRAFMEEREDLDSSWPPNVDSASYAFPA